MKKDHLPYARTRASPHPYPVATQLLGSLALFENVSGNHVLMRDLNRMLAIPLRNGCDLLDVLGRRLQGLR